MAEEPIRTIKVYERDIEKMTRMYGGPQWRAFRLALAKAHCDHPEAMRTYTFAFVNGNSTGQPLNDSEKARRISGFHCAACRSYVFQDADGE